MWISRKFSWFLFLGKEILITCRCYIGFYVRRVLSRPKDNRGDNQEIYATDLLQHDPPPPTFPSQPSASLINHLIQSLAEKRPAGLKRPEEETVSFKALFPHFKMQHANFHVNVAVTAEMDVSGASTHRRAEMKPLYQQQGPCLQTVDDEEEHSTCR